MASPEPLTTSSPSRKRRLEDLDGPGSVGEHTATSSTPASLPTPPVSHSNNSSPLKFSPAAARAASPSSSSLTSVPEGQLDGTLSNNTDAGAAPQKRRKLTPAEKLQKQQEKEAKAKERVEAKAKREEEKRLEDEEKQRKRSEREEKKRQKEFEEQQKKQQRDLVKQKEEEEKAKKERSQMRLNSFFKAPKTTQAADPVIPAKQSSVREFQSPSKSKPSDPAAADVGPPTTLSPSKPALTDYEQCFLPFSVPANSVLAPENNFHDLGEEQDGASERIERSIASTSSTTVVRADVVAKLGAEGATDHGYKNTDKSVQEILVDLQGSSVKPVDVTTAATENACALARQQLKHVPLKYIHFEQDVRPPYYGTYTKTMPTSQIRHLARSAWSRALPNVDYDYDSEAEWEEHEEGEEGEDILSDGEDDEDSSEGEDDIEAFLDDENDCPTKKRMVLTTDLEPESSGLCWEDDRRRMHRRDGSDNCATFKGFTLGVLLRDPPSSIDPFSTTYWEKDAKKTSSASAAGTSTSNSGATMQPPARVPLNPILNGGNLKIMEEFTGKQMAGPTMLNPERRGRGRPPKGDTAGKVRRMVPAEQMEEFRRAIHGSDLTKIALVEDLKKRFPKLPKDAINNTLSTIAARIGAKEAEKRWVLL